MRDRENVAISSFVWFYCYILKQVKIVFIEDVYLISLFLLRVDPEDRIPVTSWRKDDIRIWLDEKEIEYPPTALKPELLAIVKALNRQKVFAIDKLITSFGPLGHTSLRLPPYHADLNPIELVWAQVKREVANNNRTFKVKDLLQLTKSAICNVSTENWQKCVHHTQKIEQGYWEADGIIALQPPMIIQFTASDDSSDESSIASNEL